MVKEKILVKFGNKVRELRLKQNISQEKLAEKAKVHRTYIGMIERAEKNITLINIEKIAKALEVNIYDLFTE
ncbi:MAG: helix-turn-helix transcriptional regulator [Cyanobacteria bacterium]|nr:helix-turn-helix transcriptional regulator [Cyanobacteria bacterium CG_2015-16_32_12]NCO77602.1 helix-turn-helix transcriptional regulator [Cyanobacteria bacterium CG_2015-22_32_23]NCQ05687.1 helix-turn-helix transcriptional regulator [Cyanobacteria bacterium CG_2015-09_32_10]NCQ41894.1 helix-turn-helix transcriptional regulator [Cyanobacteria bacterium CG_2015-04_32_10]NCS83448.1 helix-turn-helix transcriptional regulator [Cyanobacteria bacterium CG_2015-02_32_10]